MKTRPVFPLLLSMSLPMVFSMLVTSLYNIIDSFFVARISENAMTALSLVFPVQNLVNAIAIGFSVGINAVISYYLGAEEYERANAAATQGLVLNVLHGLVLTITCILIMPSFLRMFTTDAALLDLGLRYSNIVFGFSVVIMLALTFEKIFQSVGRMLVSMGCMLCGCVANIVLDPLLIFGVGPFPELGIEGAAIATGIGQTLSLAMYLLVFVLKPVPVRLSPKYGALTRQTCGELYAIGIPAALNLALPSLLISALNTILAAYSQMYIVVLGVYYKLQTFLYLPASGIVQGMRPLIGYNFGAKEHKRVKSIYQTALLLTAAIMAVGTVLCWVMPETLLRLFSDSEQTVQAGAAALRIISLGFVVSTVSVISSGALEGVSMGTASLTISLLRYTVLIIPIAFLLSRLFDASGVWHAFWVSELLTAVIAWRIYQKKLSPVTAAQQTQAGEQAMQ